MPRPRTLVPALVPLVWSTARQDSCFGPVLPERRDRRFPEAAPARRRLREHLRHLVLPRRIRPLRQRREPLPHRLRRPILRHLYPLRPAQMAGMVTCASWQRQQTPPPCRWILQQRLLRARIQPRHRRRPRIQPRHRRQGQLRLRPTLLRPLEQQPERSGRRR